jgi:glycosyltransferase involved in cell wall biosynthesis
MSKILILANHYNTLRIFRRELVKELSARGHEVVVSIPEADDENIKLLESYGCQVIITNFDRRGINPVHDLKLLIKYFRLIDLVKPEKIITYTIKPNIYGAIAAKSRGIEHYVNITGLGSSFQTENLTKKIVSILYKVSFNKANKIFFENVGNRDTLVEKNIVKFERTVVMPGAGVNLQDFPFSDYPIDSESIRFLFIGRIMREKGVGELFYVIPKIKSLYPNTIFEFIGWYEDDYKKIVRSMEENDLISYKGFKPNVQPFIKSAHCVVLPSYHEGMSNTLLESASMGRPLITSNIHGCREAVVDGESGYLVNIKDRDDLYEKIKRFIELPLQQKKYMGKKSREHVERLFDKNKVVEKTIKEIYL